MESKAIAKFQRVSPRKTRMVAQNGKGLPVEEALNQRVKVSGGQPYIGQHLNRALIHAEEEAKQMGDEYVSVEHLFLSLLDHPSPSILPDPLAF